MKLLEALIHAARFSVNPTFSLFHCSAKGKYDLLTTVKTVGVFGSTANETAVNAQKIVDRFKTESAKPETVGLEIRCEGMRVDFSGT